MIEITREDFAEIGQLAKHCDLQKLEIAIQETLMFDIEPLFCNLYPDIVTNWKSDDADWNELINGGVYQNCLEVNKNQYGVKRVILYYAYARYVVLNNFNDTPSGSVTKINSFSLPKPLKELEQFSNKYRNMGFKMFKQVEDFLCVSTQEEGSVFANFNRCNCGDCGCGDGCCDGTDSFTKGFGIKSKNVSKWGA